MDQLKNKRWWSAVGTRMIRTAAQSGLALIGTNTVGVTSVDWQGVVSAAALAAIVSLLMAFAGLPEVDDKA